MDGREWIMHDEWIRVRNEEVEKKESRNPGVWSGLHMADQEGRIEERAMIRFCL